MNKKAALSVGAIIVVVLGLLVILLIVTGPLKTGYEYASEKFFGEKGVFSIVTPSHEEDFVPYEYLELSDEEKIIDDSVKAFVCAINSLAIGKKGWLLDDVCPDGFTTKEARKKQKQPEKQKQEATTGLVTVANAILDITGASTIEECNGALYGQSCVECETLKQDMKTIVLEDTDVKARDQLVKATIECWKKFKSGDRDNVYCYTVKMPENPWYSWEVSMDEFRDELNKDEEVGDDIAGYSSHVFGRWGQNFDWRIPDPLDNDFKQSKFYICADSGGWGKGAGQRLDIDEVFLTTDLSQCPLKKTPLAEDFKCEVKDFELPQQITTHYENIVADVTVGKLVRFAQEWMIRYNDPKYLVYYESFPMGEETVWQVNPGSFFIDVVLVGSFMNVVPVVGSYGKGGLSAAKGVLSKTWNKVFSKQAAKAGKESAEVLIRKAGTELGKELSETAVKQMVNVFSEEGVERMYRSERLYKVLMEGFEGVEEKTASEIKEKVLLRYFYYSKKGFKKPEVFIKNIRKDVLSDIPQQHLFKNPKAAAKNAKVLDDAIEAFVKNPLTKAEKAAFQNEQAAKQFFVKYLLKESGEGLNKEMLDQLFKKAVSKELFSEIGEEATEQIMKRAVGYADEIVDLNKQGFRMWNVPVIGTKGADDLEKVAKELTFINGAKIEKFVFGVSRAEIKEAVEQTGGKWASTKAIYSRYTPFYFGTTTGKIIPIKRPAILKTLVGTAFYKTPKAGATIAKDTLDAAWRSRAVRYSLAVIIGMSMAQADANNDKFSYRGGDSIVLQKPYRFESNRVYTLSKDTKPFYMNLFKYKDKNKGNTRFFMASPCKTDLIISKKMCSCEINNNDYLLKSYNQTVRPDSIKFDPEKDIKAVYTFQDMIKGSEVPITMGCVDPKYYPFSRGCFLNIKNNPVIHDKFLHYVYDNVYLSGFRFLKNNEAYAAEYLVPSNLFTIHQFGGSILFGNKPQKKDPDFPGFYVLSAQGMVRESQGHVLKLFAKSLIESDTKFRDTPVDFEKFVDFFEESYYDDAAQKYLAKSVAWWNDPIVNIYYSMNTANNERVLNDVFPDLFDRNNFLAMAANNTMLHFNWVLDDQIDTSNIVKVCDITGEKTTDSVFEFVSGDIMTGRVHTNCFSAQASLAKGYNDNHNFCFSGDHSYIEQGKWVATGLAIAIDVAVGLTGVGLIVEAPVAMLTGATAAWVGHELDKKQWWPNH